MSVPKFKKLNLDVYKPGKSKIGKLKDIIKLSANESALGISPNAKSVIKSKDSKLYRYPDPQSKALRKTISKITTKTHKIVFMLKILKIPLF